MNEVWFLMSLFSGTSVSLPWQRAPYRCFFDKTLMIYGLMISG